MDVDLWNLYDPGTTKTITPDKASLFTRFLKDNSTDRVNVAVDVKANIILVACGPNSRRIKMHMHPDINDRVLDDLKTQLRKMEFEGRVNQIRTPS